jgi:predicted PurR-regulated permease PerM
VALLLLGAAALFVAFWLLVRLRSLLVLLLISFFLSFAIEPPVNLLARRGWRRGPATAVVFAALAVAVVLFVAAVGSLLVGQIADLVDAIPGYAQQVADFLNDRLGLEVSGGELAEDLRSNQGVRDFVNGLAAGAVGLSTTLVGLVLQGLTVGLFTLLPGCRRPPAAPYGLVRCCPPAARRWRCASGTWPSTVPAATSTPVPSSPAVRRWPPPCS